MDTNNIVQEFRARGKTQHDFCNENGISIEKLRYYLYKKNRLNRKKSANTSLVASPASFITFAQKTPVNIDTKPGSAQCYTIIHGKFTIEALSSLLKMAH